MRGIFESFHCTAFIETKGAGMALTHLPPTNVSWVQFPGPVSCGLSLLLVLFLAPRGFSPGTPVFPSRLSSETNISKLQFDLDLSRTLS